MAKVRINKMTVPELVTYCKEQRQGESCPEDCALRKLGCSKFLPALWDVEGRRRDEQREDAIDMVRHLVAAYGIYPEDAFPGIQYAPMTPGVIVDGGRTGPDSVPGQTTARVPNWYKAAIGKETSAPEAKGDGNPAPVLTVGLAESECVWADETASEADKPSAAVPAVESRGHDLNVCSRREATGDSAGSREVDEEKCWSTHGSQQGRFTRPEHVKSEGVPGRGEAPAGEAPALETEKNIADVQAAARAAGMSYGRYVSMQETAARILGKAEPADAEKNEREAEAILNAGKDKTAKRRGRPPRKAAE